MTRRTILTIEDDHAIRRGVADALGFAGYAVLTAADGREGLAKLRECRYDLVLLDLVLPGASGFDLLKETQKLHPGLPVIILSALGEEEDRVRGLRHGADDYVVKPFSVKELLARVEAVLRRSPERAAPPQILDFGGGKIDFAQSLVHFLDGSHSELSERENALLHYLAEHPGRTVSREELLRRLWGVDARRTETRTVDMHIANLRAKLRDDATTPQFLRTIRGKGYALSLPSSNHA